MSARIAPIAECHVEGFHACLDTVAREQRYLAQIQAPPLDRIRTFVTEGITAGAAQFVALDSADGDRVVGWCDIFPAWAHAVQHCGTVGMGVLPAWRGQGIGAQLLAACIAKAQANGLTRITLEARADNARAIRLYTRLGFQHEALKRQALRYNGVYFDAVQMSLLLTDAGAPMPPTP